MFLERRAPRGVLDETTTNAREIPVPVGLSSDHGVKLCRAKHLVILCKAEPDLLSHHLFALMDEAGFLYFCLTMIRFISGYSKLYVDNSRSLMLLFPPDQGIGPRGMELRLLYLNLGAVRLVDLK